MSKTLDGLQTYYECTECGATVSAGEVPAHEFVHFKFTNKAREV